MRKALLFAPMLMLLLTACGGGPQLPAGQSIARPPGSATTVPGPLRTTTHSRRRARSRAAASRPPARF